MARPKKVIDWGEVLKRMEAGISAKIISQIFNVDTDTFYLRFKEEFNCSFQDYSANYHECGKSNIIYTQYLKALEGNTNMLTLLGKEWCGQGKTDMSAISPIQSAIDQTHRIMELEHQLLTLKEKLEENDHKPETE